MESGDRAKSEKRYKSTALKLQNVFPNDIRSRLEEVTFPQFEVIDAMRNKAKALGEVLEIIIQARSEIKKESKRKIGSIVISWFNASYPFATLVITVAKEGSSVFPNKSGAKIQILNPYGLLCGGLLVLMKVPCPNVIYILIP